METGSKSFLMFYQQDYQRNVKNKISLKINNDLHCSLSLIFYTEAADWLKKFSRLILQLKTFEINF